MIHVKFWMEEGNKCFCMSVEGHAYADEPGKDIVCAAVSVLAQTKAKDVEDDFLLRKLAEEPIIDIKNGYALVKSCPKASNWKEVKAKFLQTQKGFALLADSYPQYISLIKFEMR